MANYELKILFQRPESKSVHLYIVMDICSNNSQHLWASSLNATLTKKIFIKDFYLPLSSKENWYYKVLKLLSIINVKPSFYEQKQIDIEMIKENLMNMLEENRFHPD